MKKIPLTQGKFALIDDEDFGMVNQYTWHTVKKPQTFYAHTTIYKDDGGHTNLRMHRLILNPPDCLQVDHRDGNGLNNCRSNIRVCTQSQNQHNQRPRKGCSSQYKGVSWFKETNKWRAYIKLNGKRQYLGFFTNEIEAAKAYDTAAEELFREFAWVNFPVEIATVGVIT